ncbi:hypothetical protein I4F81_003890 [Pyropia yezoensis]|uniref:Uncharacterized protein n=1 Tax=Pyropia yezoensis TaxID=2788 RepID=A0ACC3BV12_PYRYE|nr:hypothetical protein I4F81_003890 [Neopyropia yezoensis]
MRLSWLNRSTRCTAIQSFGAYPSGSFTASRRSPAGRDVARMSEASLASSYRGLSAPSARRRGLKVLFRFRSDNIVRVGGGGGGGDWTERKGRVGLRSACGNSTRSKNRARATHRERGVQSWAKDKLVRGRPAVGTKGKHQQTAS